MREKYPNKTPILKRSSMADGQSVKFLVSKNKTTLNNFKSDRSDRKIS